MFAAEHMEDAILATALRPPPRMSASSLDRGELALRASGQAGSALKWGVVTGPYLCGRLSTLLRKISGCFGAGFMTTR